MGNAAKAALSALIVFHLYCVTLAPIRFTSYLGMRSLGFLAPYVNFLELANAWSFFAPDPGPPPVYVEWELLDERGNLVGTGSWPDRQDPFILRERQNRRVAAAEFMVTHPARVERMMLPYVCGHFPQAHSVRLYRTIYSIPDREGILSGRRVIGDREGMKREFVSHSFCEERKP